MPDLELQINGKWRTVEWGSPTPPTQEQLKKIVALAKEKYKSEKSEPSYFDKAWQTTKKVKKAKPADPLEEANKAASSTPLGKMGVDYASVTGKGMGFKGSGGDRWSQTGPSMTPQEEANRKAEEKRTGVTRMPFGPLDVAIKPAAAVLDVADQATKPIREPVQKAAGSALEWATRTFLPGANYEFYKGAREFGEFAGDPVNYVPVAGVNKLLKGKKGKAPVAAAEESTTVVGTQQIIKPKKKPPPKAEPITTKAGAGTKSSGPSSLEPWQMTQSELVDIAGKNRAKRQGDFPWIVRNKETGEVVAEIKESQVAKLNTKKYSAEPLGGGQRKPIKATDDDGWIGNVQQRHEYEVQQALKEGKPVPANVLTDYPDLAAKYRKTTVPTSPATGPKKKVKTLPDREAPSVDEMTAWVKDEKGSPGFSEAADRFVGTQSRHFVYRDQNGDVKGILTYTKGTKDHAPTINVAVEPALQRQGIATKLYEMAEKAGVPVEQVSGSQGMTKAGKALYDARAAKKVKTLQPRQESIAEVRKDTGRKPYEREVIGTKEAIDGGRKLHQEGHATAIANQFKTGEIKALSADQTVALDLRGNQLLDDIAKETDTARIAQLDQELDDVLDALNKSGTRQSADFRARQLEYRKASDELVMMQRAQSRKPGGKLTDTERGEITRLSGEVKRLQGELSKAEAQAALSQAERARKIAAGKVKRATRLEESRAKHDAGVQYWKDNPITSEAIGAIPIPKISGKHFDAVKDIVKYRLEAGVYKIADLVDEVRKVAGGISDSDIYLAIRQAAGEHGAILNKGRTLGEDIQVSGKSGIQSPEIMAARRALDKAKMEADAYIEKFRPKTVGSRIDEAVTGNVLLNPVARIFDLAANTAKGVGYGVTNLARVPIGKALSKAAGKEYGGEQLLFTGGKLKRILAGAPQRWKDKAIRVAHGTDLEEVSKYGRGNIVSRLTGLSDIPFKDFYYRQAIDDAADNIAKSRNGGAKMRDEILAQLDDPTLPGPLKPDELAEIASHAQDWALRQTFNSDNWASSLIEGAKRGIRQLAKGKGPLQEEAADLGIAAGNTFVRFSRVIGNVALERASYAVRIPGTPIPLGLVEGGLRTVFGFAKGTLNPNELRLIADLTTKGLSGMALFEWGKYLYRNGVYKPEIVKTENGTVYVDHGDLAQIGAWLTPILSGAAEEAIAKDPRLTDKQREKARWDNNVGLLADQPIASGTERGLKSLARGDDLVKVAGQTAANALIPGGVRDWARRQDSYIHRDTLFKERRVEIEGVGDQFKKGLPQTPLNPNFNRVKMKTKGKKKKGR